MAQELITNRTRGPQTQIQAGPLNDQRREANVLQGLEQFSAGLKQLGDFEREKKVKNDVITAQIAFEMERELPGSLAPEAELAYNNLVAQKTTKNFLATFEEQSRLSTANILQDDTIPRVDKQVAHDQIMKSHQLQFLGAAGFTEAQIVNITPMLEEQSFRASYNFNTLNAQDATNVKIADGNEFVKREIEFTMRQFNDANEDGNMRLSAAFTPETFERYADQLHKAYPSFTRDEVDLMVFEQVRQVALDPLNPQPELAEVYDQKRKGGKPKFSSIASLRKPIFQLRQQAHALNVQVRTAAIKAEKDALVLLQTKSNNLAGNWVFDNFKNPKGPILDPVNVEAHLRQQFPDLKEQNLRQHVKHHASVVNADGFSSYGTNELALFMTDIDAGTIESVDELMGEEAYQGASGFKKQLMMNRWMKWSNDAVSESDVFSLENRKDLGKEAGALLLETAGLKNRIKDRLGIPKLSFNELRQVNDLEAVYASQAELLVEEAQQKKDFTTLRGDLARKRNEIFEAWAATKKNADGSPVVVQPSSLRNKEDASTEEKIRPQDDISKVSNLDTQPKEANVGDVVDTGVSKKIVKSSDVSALNINNLPTEMNKAVHIPAPIELEEIQVSSKEATKPFTLQDLGKLADKNITTPFVNEGLNLIGDTIDFFKNETLQSVGVIADKALTDVLNAGVGAINKVSDALSTDAEGGVVVPDIVPQKPIAPPKASFIKKTATKNTLSKELKSDELLAGKINLKAFKDSRGVPTIGVGFNLLKAGARERIEKLGLNYNDVLSGKVGLSEEQSETLFEEDIQTAKRDAQSIFKSFSTLDADKRNVLTNMSFQLGKTSLSKFTLMIKAVDKGDFNEASKQMLNSEWAKQTPERAKRLAKRLSR